MKKEYIEDQNFKGENYSTTPLKQGEYNNCAFINCTFSNADLSDTQFIECTFDSCDLSNAKLKNTAFQDVNFTNSKLLGLHFDDCKDFLLSFNFDNCLLNYASFYKLKIKNTRFINCKMEDVSFEKTDLANAVFSYCELHKALFDNTNLEGADFRTSVNFSINPELNSMKKARFSAQNLAGLLDKYKISIE
jgi:fluoroquinolone resistance protein